MDNARVTAPYANAPADVPSPCVGICIVGSAGHCIGCFRTREELARWWTATADEKRSILERCRARAESGQD